MVCDGNLPGGLPLIIAQGVCGSISSIIYVWKLINYFGSRKAKVSELEYIKNKINKGAEK